MLRRSRLHSRRSDERLARITTRLLVAAAAIDAAAATHVGRSADTYFTDGDANDAAGTIHLSDADRSRVPTISPRGRIATLVADPHLAQVDAMRIDDRGNLLIPASRPYRTAGPHAGMHAATRPMTSTASRSTRRV